VAIDLTVALIALADAKAFLQITGSTQDGIIGDLINEVSVWIKNYVGHELLSATYTEYYDGDGTEELILKNFPVTTLTSVNDDPTRVFGAATAKSVASDVMLDASAGVVRLWNNGGIFQRARGNLKVVYVAGYSLATMPYDIQLAVRKMVAFLYRSSYAMPKIGVQTETVGDRTTTYFNEEILKDVGGILKPYRSVFSWSRSFA
jgi:uncharacterized phiE125 gp8 family phage protein